MKTTTLTLITILIIVSLSGVYGIVTYASGKTQTGTITATQPFSATAGNNSTPYVVTLLETMGNKWNSTAAESQPMFFVVGPTGLESSAANISLPAHRLIELVIISYDTPTPPPAQYSNVTGTVGGKMYLINGTSASMATPQSWGTGVSYVPTDQISHTFTIVLLGINIPIGGGDTVIAFLDLNQTGTFTWQCYTPCGFPNVNGGWSGAMVTPGWMVGQVTVYQEPTPAPASAQSTPAGISIETAAVLAFGTLIVGCIIGLVVLPRSRESSRHSTKT